METVVPFLLSNPRSNTTARINIIPKVRYDTADRSTGANYTGKDRWKKCPEGYRVAEAVATR
jgi:hypothetical protein